MLDPHHAALSRRHFLQRTAAASLAFGGLSSVLARAAAARATLPAAAVNAFGPLIPDPARVLDLPRGFSYHIFSRAGETMDDGLLVPTLHDGMAAFPTPSGKTILVRNHENDTGGPNQLGPWGRRNESLDKTPAELIYDRGQGRSPCLGGTTTLLYDTRTKKLERHILSLAGTARNCAGGITPWGTWLTCEETTQRAEFHFERDHGYVFEVPASADLTRPIKPVPLKAMGRFNHEAAAVDARTGIVYMSEDRGAGCLFRFIPLVPGKLAEGGTLQALAVVGKPKLDTHNWDGDVAVRLHEKLGVEWIDLENPESPDDDLRLQAYAKGAARFARNEGMVAGSSEIYFVCTSGGAAKLGQVWRLTPGAARVENGRTIGEETGTLELFCEPNDTTVMEHGDNICIAPWGDLVVCEDGTGEQFLLGITPAGEVYKFARNAMSKSEFAGCTFSPDGSTLFVNIQHPGLTLAITGPWKRAGA